MIFRMLSDLFVTNIYGVTPVSLLWFVVTLTVTCPHLPVVGSTMPRLTSSCSTDFSISSLLPLEITLKRSEWLTELTGLSVMVRRDCQWQLKEVQAGSQIWELQGKDECLHCMLRPPTRIWLLCWVSQAGRQAGRRAGRSAEFLETFSDFLSWLDTQWV